MESVTRVGNQDRGEWSEALSLVCAGAAGCEGTQERETGITELRLCFTFLSQYDRSEVRS